NDEIVKDGSERDDDDDEEALAKIDEPEDTDSGRGGDEVTESEREITTSSDAPIPSTTIPSIILKNLPTFNSAFCFDERLMSLETTFSEYRQTNLFVNVVSAIPGIVHQYMTQQITEAIREGVQIQTYRLQDSLQQENDEFLCNIDENMKKIIKGQ
nr:hypothetical protein [Tanacetum cinerariifolium]